AVLAATAIMAVALTASLGRTAMALTLRLIKPLWPMVALLMLFHVLFGRIDHGVVISLRLVALILLANFVTLTTPLADMMRLIRRVLAPLRRFGVNVRAISVAMGLVIRFTPLLLLRAQSIRESWRARSAKPARWKLVPPIGLSVLDDAEHVSDALRARGGVRDI
ncbi:MAG: CbiQ family ECF transporter T component, partial [Alphaproteobacteria bacterium]